MFLEHSYSKVALVAAVNQSIHVVRRDACSLQDGSALFRVDGNDEFSFCLPLGMKDTWYRLGSHNMQKTSLSSVYDISYMTPPTMALLPSVDGSSIHLEQPVITFHHNKFSSLIFLDPLLKGKGQQCQTGSRTDDLATCLRMVNLTSECNYYLTSLSNFLSMRQHTTLSHIKATSIPSVRRSLHLSNTHSVTRMQHTTLSHIKATSIPSVRRSLHLSNTHSVTRMCKTLPVFSTCIVQQQEACLILEKIRKPIKDYLKGTVTLQ